MSEEKQGLSAAGSGERIRRKSSMLDYRIARSGFPSLAFSGELLATASSEDAKGLEKRYHKLALYKTKGGSWVIHIQYLTTWNSEVSHSEVLVTSQRSEIIELLENYNAEDDVHIPDGPKYDHLASIVMRIVCETFDSIVSELLSQVADMDESLE